MVRSNGAHPGARWPSRAVTRMRPRTCWNGRRGRRRVTGQRPTLLTFIAQLGAALSEMGEPVSSVQDRLTAVARPTARRARVSAFPTYFMISMGTGEPVVLELTTSFGGSFRLDQFSAVDRLVGDATRGTIDPAEGLAQLAAIRTSAPRFTTLVRVLGYCVLTVGLTLILDPAPSDVAAGAMFGLVVGALREVAASRPNLRVLLPVLAAFIVAALAALAVRHDLVDPPCAPSSPRSSCSSRGRR